MTIPACGEDDPASGNTKPDAVPAEQVIEDLVIRPAPGASGGSKPVKPRITPPDPLPEDFLIEDLEEGSGPPSERGDKLLLEYLAVNPSGKTLYSSWWREEPFTMNLGSGYYYRAFEEGVKGMRVGGRRAMVIPASLTEGFGALVYAVDLLKIDGDPKRKR